MALFGGSKDNDLFKCLNRELMGNIISQQSALYKFILPKTKTNIYGEVKDEAYYMGPVLLNCLIARDPQSYDQGDLDTNYSRAITFRFLRDDLIDAEVMTELGDIILYQEAYYEIDGIVDNQFVVGKDPEYPNNPNPLNPGLEEFGKNFSVICEAHHIPDEKVGITRERLI